MVIAVVSFVACCSVLVVQNVTVYSDSTKVQKAKRRHTTQSILTMQPCNTSDWYIKKIKYLKEFAKRKTTVQSSNRSYTKNYSYNFYYDILQKNKKTWSNFSKILLSCVQSFNYGQFFHHWFRFENICLKVIGISNYISLPFQLNWSTKYNIWEMIIKSFRLRSI